MNAFEDVARIFVVVDDQGGAARQIGQWVGYRGVLLSAACAGSGVTPNADCGRSIPFNSSILRSTCRGRVLGRVVDMESKHRVDLVRDYMNAELETGARVPS